MKHEDPMTPLGANMARLHELFRGLVEAGFTADHAIRLLAELIARAEGGEK